MRVVGSSHADPYSATAAAAPPLRPRHGGPTRRDQDVDRDRQHRQRAAIRRVVKSGGGRLQASATGSTRATTPCHHHQAHATGVLRHGKNPLLDIALKLEEIALSRLFHLEAPLPTSISTRLIYQPWASRSRCSGLFAIPHSRVLTHWQEMLDQDSKIARPRQLYIGDDARDYVPVEARAKRSPGEPSWTIETHRRPERSKRKPRARPSPRCIGESES